MKEETNKIEIREAVWKELRKVAKPDSRFHWDFSMFIPDYRGSTKCADRIRELDIYKKSSFIMITPDNNLEKLREYCVKDGKTYVMPTYGIVRGFVKLSRKEVPVGMEEFSSTLDGAERYGISVTLRDIQKIGKVDFMVTGASAVNIEGVRYGKGHGYFDLEWAMFREIGVVCEETPVIAVVHDCQVTERKFLITPYDTIVDLIVTPTRVIKIDRKYKKPVGIVWEKLRKDMLKDIPPLRELKSMQLES